jgi:ABC-2 type transport system ATP-binding protein
VIREGELILVEEKTALMQKLGRKQVILHLREPLAAIPDGLREWRVALNADGTELECDSCANGEPSDIASLLRRMDRLGIAFRDVSTRQSSLEDIFVSLVSRRTRARG